MAAAPVPTFAGPLTTVHVFNTAVTGAYAGFWSAIDGGYFQQEGIDVQIDHVDSTTRAIDALLSNSGDLSTLDGQTVALADLKGGDLKMFTAVTNRLAFSLMAQPSIATAADLKGKTVGITSPGSSADTAARQAIQLVGLQPSDVAFVPLQTNPGILAGMQTGQVAAGALSPPTNTQGRQAGMKELINLGTDGPPYTSIAIGGRASYISAHRDLMLGFVRAYARGVQRFKTDQAFGVGILTKYLSLDDQSVAQDTWSQFKLYLADVPLIDPQGMQNAINSAAASDPTAANAPVDQFVDNSLAQQLQDQGFFSQLGLQ